MYDIKAFLEKYKDTELYKVLRNIWDNDRFVFCSLCNLDTEEKRQKLLNYIKEHDITDSGDVGELVDCIEDGIEPEFEDE